ncbi:MAG: gamma-glutamyltransferase [Anderseniella sp.]
MRNFHVPSRSAVYAGQACVATSSPQASLAAIEILRSGGNAVDAAIAASAILCVTEPQMTAVGGDCFALIGHADGSVNGLNASGRASKRADEAWLKSSGLREIATDNINAVTVPGAVDGWAALLDRFGSMSLGDVLQPAIQLAHNGHPVGPRTASDWAGLVDFIGADEGGRMHYLPNGKAPAAGQMITQPALARTLEIIARDGRDGFYEGEVARDIVATVQAKGSLISMEDLAETKSSWVEPVGTIFQGREILEIPPNGSGLTALVALNILSRFDLAQYAPESVERRHLEIEAIRLAWVIRNRHIADMGFAHVPIEEILSDKMTDKLAAQISMSQAIPEPDNVVPLPGSDTVYLSIVDKDRMAVSFINSIYHGFGSGIVTPKTGIILQNRGAGFSAVPGHPNCIGPGKRPLHTIIPAMVREKGKVVQSFGVMGGAYQPMGHVAMMVNRYVYGMDPQEALDFPRSFHEDGKLGIEQGVPANVAEGLRALGHVVHVVEDPYGGGQIIAIDPESGVLCGGSEPRKDGFAVGF